MTETRYRFKWENHQPDFFSVFSDLFHSETMVDVTLAAEGKFVQVHKIVLSASSSYFQAVLRANPCQHPIVILKDVTFKDLKTVVEFIYYGEVNVLQEDIPSLLKTAELLQVKGLINYNNASNSFDGSLVYETANPFSSSKPSVIEMSSDSGYQSVGMATIGESLVDKHDHNYESINRFSYLEERENLLADRNTFQCSADSGILQSPPDYHPSDVISDKRRILMRQNRIEQDEPPELEGATRDDSAARMRRIIMKRQNSEPVRQDAPTSPQKMACHRPSVLRKQNSVPCSMGYEKQPPDTVSHSTPNNSYLQEEEAGRREFALAELSSKLLLSENKSKHCPVLRNGPALGCGYCWNTIDAQGRTFRRKTKYHCPECATNLCIVPCFQAYHDKKSELNGQNDVENEASSSKTTKKVLKSMINTKSLT